MISGNIDIRSLGRQINKMADAIGETSETAIARWGVAVSRRLTIETQVFGDGKEAYEKQKGAILEDAYRVIGVVKSMSEAKLSNAGFARDRRILRTPGDVNQWINSLRKLKTKRTIRLQLKYKAITTERVFNAAMTIRFRSIWKGKGGWIGAGQDIARFQKGRGKLTIGRGFAYRAHRWKAGGSSRMKRHKWSPEGTMVNSVPWVATEHVLQDSATNKALMDGARNTITWYEKVLEARLKKL